MKNVSVVADEIHSSQDLGLTGHIRVVARIIHAPEFHAHARQLQEEHRPRFYSLCGG